MSQTLLIALKIMGQGMLGIFASILLIMIAISLIGKICSFIKTDEDNLP